MKVNILIGQLIVRDKNINSMEKDVLINYLNSDCQLSYLVNEKFDMFIHGGYEPMYKLLFEMSKNFDVELI